MINVAKEVLRTYTDFSGQLINYEKTQAFFSKNVSQQTRRSICSDLGVVEGGCDGRYLGMPFMIGKSRRRIFGYIEDRVRKKLAGWKEKMLSSAGKEVLIKSVIQAIPNYVMQCFTLPVSICNTITSLTRKFWWSNKNQDRPIFWKSWDQICLMKQDGGLGFRDIRAANLAMLAKQGWRLVEHPNSLVARVLKAKYYPNSDFLSAALGTRPSFLWRSLCDGRQVLKLGVRFRVGNGAGIRLWDDPWVPKPYGFRISQRNRHLLPQGKVQDIIDWDQHTWNMEMLQQLFYTYEIDEITNIPLTTLQDEDKIIWHHTKNDIYTVKSGTRVLQAYQRHMQAGGEPSTSHPNKALWSKLWRLPVLPKVRVFLWKVVNGVLPTAANLHRRMQDFCPSCKICGSQWEDDRHCLFDCVWLKNLWERWLKNHRWDRIRSCNFQQLLLSIFENEGEEKICFFSHLLWLIWKNRCRGVFEDAIRPAKDIFNDAQALTQTTATACNRKVHMTWGERTLPRKWEAPPVNEVAINVDAAFGGDCSNACGIVVRQSNGEIKLARTEPLPCNITVDHGELLAIVAGLRAAKMEGYDRVNVWSDSLSSVQWIRMEDDSHHPLRATLLEVRQLMLEFQQCNVRFVRREGNIPAHLLAKIGLSFHSVHVWCNDFPVDVCSAAIADVM